MSRRALGSTIGLAFWVAACGGADTAEPSRDASLDGSDSGSIAAIEREAAETPSDDRDDLATDPVRELADSDGAALEPSVPDAVAAEAELASPVGAPFAESVAPARDSVTSIAAAAARPGFIAAWNRKNAFITVDDGRTWSRVLDGSGRIVAASMDADGALHVVRSNRTLATRAPDGSISSRRIPDALRTIAFASGGGRLAWWGRVRGQEDWDSTLRYSDDGGVTWIQPEEVSVHEGNFANSLEVLDDRTIIAWSGSEAACGGGARHRWTVSPEGRFDTTDAYVDPFLLAGRGADGVVYALYRYCAGATPNGGGEGPICAVSLEGEDTERPIFDSGEDWRLEVVTNGDRTLGLLGRRLLSLEPMRASEIDPAVPESMELAGVDADGRALALAKGRVVRRDHDGTWRILR